MNAAILFSLARSALKIGGTALGVHAMLSPDGSTLQIALGIAAPVVGVAWSWLTHLNTPTA